MVSSDLNSIRTMVNSDLNSIRTLANSGLIFIWTLANSDLVFMWSELASGLGPNWLRSELTIAEVRIDQGLNRPRSELSDILTADILTKVLLKCFWSSPLPTIWILSKSLILIGGHGNRKAKFSKNKKKTFKNLEAGDLDVDNLTKLWRGTYISIGWYIHSFIHSVLLPVNGCRGTTDNF